MMDLPEFPTEKEVVEAFLEDEEEPTPDMIGSWLRAYPEHREAIYRIAATVLELNILQEGRRPSTRH